MALVMVISFADRCGKGGKQEGERACLPSAIRDTVTSQHQGFTQMNAEKKSHRGNEPVTLRLPQDMIVAVDELRRRAHDIPSRQEMIRRILTEWMAQNAPDTPPAERGD